VQEGVNHAKGSYESRGIEVTLTPARPQRVVLPRSFVVEAVAGLVTNAAEVPRPEDRQPGTISVSVAEDGRGIRVLVSDDGVGLARDERRKLFVEARTHKGHVGIGLIRTRQVLRLYGGEVDLEKTGPTGSIFFLDLPTVGIQRKR
jgi:sensor histidine kinase regulating citrate/malate metabolism